MKNEKLLRMFDMFCGMFVVYDNINKAPVMRKEMDDMVEEARELIKNKKEE